MDVYIESSEEPGIVDNADVPLSSSDTVVPPDGSTVINSTTALPDSTETSVDDATDVPVTQDTGLSDSIVPVLPNNILDSITSQEASNTTVSLTQGENTVTASSDNYLEELWSEKRTLDPIKYMHTIRLLEGEINHISPKCGSPGSTLNQPITIEDDEHMYVNLTEKVFFPIDECPLHNFVPNLLGPRGSNLQSIARQTKTKISICGKGSTRDRAREEELSKSENPQYAHFNEPLYVLIQSAGPKYEAQLHINYAVNEIKMYIEKEKKSFAEPADPYKSRRPFDNDPHEYINLSEKVFVPVKENQSYQFVSRLLGPRGSNLKSIAFTTKTRISILGKGSSRDKSKEQELIKSNDPRHQHLKEPLHVLVKVSGPRREAQLRLSSALREIKLYMDDDVNHVEPKLEVTEGRRPLDFEESLKLSEKIFLPVDEYPSNNFVGKLLGPKGSNMRNIAATTKTRISILGKGSTRDQNKEAELADSNDPKYEHFKEPLHVLIQAAGPRYASQGHLNDAIVEINRCIKDEIKHVRQTSMNLADSMKERRPFDNDEYVHLNENVFLPVDQYPSYNFIGRLLGPNGNNLRSIAASRQPSTTKTRISIYGRGSTRNPDQEEALSKSSDPQYQHLKEPLHVHIRVSGPKYAAQVRLNAALSEVKKYIGPEKFEIREKLSDEYALMNNPAAHGKHTQENLFNRNEKDSIKEETSFSSDGQSSSKQDKLNDTTEGYSYKTYDTTNYCDYSYNKNKDTSNYDNYTYCEKKNTSNYTYAKDNLSNYDSYTYGNKRPIPPDDQSSLSTSDNNLPLPEKRSRDSCDDGNEYDMNDDTYGSTY